MRKVIAVGLVSLLSASCAANECMSGECVDDTTDDTTSESSAALSTAAPLVQSSGAWWNDKSMLGATGQIDEVWAEVGNVLVDHQVSGNLTMPVTCHLPAVAGNTLTVVDMIAQVDSTNVVSISNPGVDVTHNLTIQTSKFKDGYHEIRVRCKAEQTQGTEKGKITAVTNGFPIVFANGTGTGSGQNSGTDYVDAHAWYSTDIATGDAINYVYAQLNGVHELTDKPIKGTVNVNGRVRNSGATTIDHWMLTVDDTIVIMFHGTTQTRTVPFDTTKFANGKHVLKFHGHGLAKSGKQLAAQVNVTIDIEN